MIIIHANFFALGTQCDTNKICLDGNCVAGNATITQVLSQNACLENPCQNDGLCSPIYQFYICKCKNGFTGKNCENKI